MNKYQITFEEFEFCFSKRHGFTESSGTPKVPQVGVLSLTLFNNTQIGLTKILPRSVRLSLSTDDICFWRSSVSQPYVFARFYQAVTVILVYVITARDLMQNMLHQTPLQMTCRQMSNLYLRHTSSIRQGSPLPPVLHLIDH